MELHSLIAAHWPQVRAIYEQGLATGQAAFQTDEVVRLSEKEQGDIYKFL